jgi:hypothetical protein
MRARARLCVGLMSAQLSPMEYRERNESPSNIMRDTYARTRSSLSKGEKKRKMATRVQEARKS